MQQIGNSPPVADAARWIEAMRRGDFPAAWAVADAVLAARDPATRDDPRLPYHRRWVWDGTAPDGRDVLVRCYHGLGDTLQFARYLAPLRARARRVTLEAPPELLGVLLGVLHPLAGVDRLVAFDHARPLPPAEVDVEIMELSHALRLAPFPSPLPSPEGRGRSLLPLPPGEGRGEGPTALCWQSGAWDRERSIPLPALLAALGRARPLLSLQRGPAGAEAVAPGFLNPGDDDRDVGRTAGLIAASRLVVTVDTMVAHLAGCLGAPTLLLLKHDPDWRWERGAGASRWYPSVTMLRQSAPGDWSAPLRALRARMAG